MNINEKRIEEENTSEIDIALIDSNPYQPRKTFDENLINELAESIKKHGIIQPILIRKKDNDRFELVAGERRLRASQIAGLIKIPAQIKDLTDTQSLEIALIENIQREDINSVETAKAYKRLTDEFGHTQEQLAIAMGKSRSAIANSLRLLQLPEEILEMLSDKHITEGHARAVLSVSEENRLPFAKRITEESLTVRDAENYARIINNPHLFEPEVIEDTTPKKNIPHETFTTNEDLKHIAKTLNKIFETKVSVLKKINKGQIVIDFQDDEHLRKIVDIMISQGE